jgi:hypothetical protein
LIEVDSSPATVDVASRRIIKAIKAAGRRFYVLSNEENPADPKIDGAFPSLDFA